MSSRRKKDVLYLKILNTVTISKNGKGEFMIIETNSEKETWDLGFSLGEKAEIRPFFPGFSSFV